MSFDVNTVISERLHNSVSVECYNSKDWGVNWGDSKSVSCTELLVLG
jgi:hypothetical protein